jgi:adenylate kinase
MKNIVIFGAPGSGKGTQSDLMIKKYGFGHISTGDVLRAEIKRVKRKRRIKTTSDLE